MAILGYVMLVWEPLGEWVWEGGWALVVSVPAVSA